MIAISGKERSGTTWLEFLLRENYATGGVDARDKHRFTGKQQPVDMLTILVSKHPVEWWFSYYIFAASIGIKFDEFPIDFFTTWNEVYYKWIEWGTRANIKFIRYDSLFRDPEGTLDDLGLRRNEFAFDRIENVVTAHGTIEKSRLFERAETLTAYEDLPRLRQAIEEMIDPGVLHYLGYDKEI